MAKQKHQASISPEQRDKSAAVMAADRMLEKEGITPFSKQIPAVAASSQVPGSAMRASYQTTGHGIRPETLGEDALEALEEARAKAEAKKKLGPKRSPKAGNIGKGGVAR